MAAEHPLQRHLRPALWLALAAGLIVYVRLGLLTPAFQDKDWSHLWLGGRMVTSGQSARLYDPQAQLQTYRRDDPNGQPPAVWAARNDILGCFNYPPPTALGYAALAWMPMQQAAVVSALLTLLVTLGVGVMLVGLVGRGLTFPAATLAVLIYPPFFINLSLGQNAMWTMIVVLAAWLLSTRGSDGWSGLVLGLLICKPNWWLALIWIPLIGCRWRLLLGMCGGAAAVLALTAMSMGPGPFVDYVDLLHKLAGIHELPNYVLDMKVNGVSMFRKWFGVGPTASVLGWSSCVVVVGATAWATAGRWNPRSPTAAGCWACALAASLWVNPHLNHYDLMLVVPISLTALYQRKAGGVLLSVSAAALVVLCYAAVPWDRSWSAAALLPLPTIALGLLWVWWIVRLRHWRPDGAVSSTRGAGVQP